MKKVLITGASGFIGSFLVEEALHRGYEVYAGIRSSSSKKYLTDQRIRFFDIDFSDKEKLKRQLADFKAKHGRFDYIVHSAGITKAKTNAEFQKVNFHYTQNLVNSLIAADCIPEKFIFISSLAAFGPGASRKPIKHTDMPKPITSYGESKLNAEKYLQSLNDFPYLIIRPAAVYGPRDHEFYVLYKVINRRIIPYVSLKNQLLSFVYVTDLTKAVFDAIESRIYRKAYFVSDGIIYTVFGFNETIRQHLKKRAASVVIPAAIAKPIAFSVEKLSALFGKVATFNRERLKEYEAFNWTCDIAPLRNDLNFDPDYDLERGMFETIKWYKKEGWL